MNRAVWRYQVNLDGPTTIRLTGDPVAVAVDMPGDAGIEFWAEHDPSKPEVARTFAIVGTGHPIPAGAAYVGTAPRSRYGLVWHLYELTGLPS
jgi:hypothetical protein